MDDLLALAESLNLEQADLDDLTDQGVGEFPESQATKWRCPPIIDVGTNSQVVNNGSIHLPDILIDSENRDSPQSPTQRNRVSLFGCTDAPIDLLTSNQFVDPRSICILDHPGRNAQFKHWLSAGFIKDDSRRATFRDESTEVGCWQRVATEDEDNNAKNILSLIRVVKPEDGVQHQDGSHVVTTSPMISLSLSSSSRSSQLKDVWESRSFMMGGSIIVAMAQMDLDDAMMLSWCAWFNDKLCSWGIHDRSTSVSDHRSAGKVNADLDFSSNYLTDASVRELVRLLGAFKRVQVGTLRLSSNSFSCNVLEPLKSLPYLRYLVLDDNRLVSHDLCEWIPEIMLIKHELYDILVAQDMPDESVKQAIFVSVENNAIFRPMDLVEKLHSKDILVCLPETSGCEATTLCRLYGASCGVHLAGLSTQRESR